MNKEEVLNYYKKKCKLEGRALIRKIADVLDCFPQTIDHWEDLVPKGRAYELFVKSNRKIPLREKDYRNNNQ